MSTGAPCLGGRTEAYPVQPPGDGRRVIGRTWGWRERVCPITDRHRYSARMAERGLERTVRIGACAATLFALRDCYDVVSEALRDGIDRYPPCHACPIRTRVVAETVPSDWDDQNNCLMPDSAAFIPPVTAP